MTGQKIGISIGGAVFEILLTPGGVAGLRLPRFDRYRLAGGRPLADARHYDTPPGFEREAGRLALFLSAMLSGQPPEVLPDADTRGVSMFTRKVLEVTAQIPWGSTLSYGAVASAIGRPGAARAVGRALGANPAPLVIPCHRVIMSSGETGGFGCGQGWKEHLLALESSDLEKNLASVS